MSAARAAATRVPNCGCVLSPVPTAVAPMASSCSGARPARDRLLGEIELRDPARDFLAQRQRRGVLQVGAADLHDVGEGGRLAGECAAQPAQGREQVVDDDRDGRDVHRGGDHVVGRLAQVHVIVRVDEARCAPRAAQQLGRPVGQHLVHVHVRLRAGAGLPHRERKLARMRTGQHLVSGLRDRLGQRRFEQAQLAIDARPRRA